MSDLTKIPEEMEPVHADEKVAFKEDHETHAGLYGYVKGVGVEDGIFRMDVIPFNPSDGVVNHDGEVRRISLEDIQ